MATIAQQTTLKAAVRMMASHHDWGICLHEADILKAEQTGLKSLEHNSFACAFDDARKHALRLSQGKTNVVLFDRRKH